MPKHTLIPSFQSAANVELSRLAQWDVYCDGATYLENPSSRGAWGFSVWHSGSLFHAAHGRLVGVIDNNIAEFQAIRRALAWCAHYGLQRPHVYTDSQLAVRVLSGEKTIYHPRLLALANDIATEISLEVTYEHVPRGDRRQAFTDFLANLGLGRAYVYTTEESHLALFAAYENWRNHE